MEKFKTFSIGLFLPSLEEKLRFKVRPNASSGLWLMFLLPTCLIISAFKYWVVLTNTYKLLLIFSIGLIFCSISIIRALAREEYVNVHELWFFFPISLLFYTFLNSGILFSIYSGVFCTLLYCQAYIVLLRTFPKSFTLGEAGLTAQAFIILLYTTLPHFYYSIEEPIVKTGQSSTVIIQMELFGILILGAFAVNFNLRHYTFYFSMVFIFLTTFLIPLHIFLKRSPLLWVLNLLTKDIATMKVVLYWLICSCLAALVILRHRKMAGKATSAERKIFHILAIAVYVPGLMYECNLLYLGSGILLGIFFLLEMLRNLTIPPLGNLLQESFTALKDEKDAGILAVTPIYLLTGFTLPLWIHPSPCDLTDSAFFNFLPLMSGILSVGVGDTAASVFGSKYGKHFYPGRYSIKFYDVLETYAL
ncbi:hypothetical protein HHI36_012023 [Cryptolaemus montrouzieri]|uniref:dolichol kinase n=1 Tax=Cryptolaemus montrouzieri TaxID=559131 RepID=A0ABD2NDE5_9CUCU